MRSRAGFETTPSLMSTAVSPPREVGGLSKTWPFPGWMLRGDMNGPQQCPPKCLCQSALFCNIRQCLRNVFFVYIICNVIGILDGDLAPIVDCDVGKT